MNTRSGLSFADVLILLAIVLLLAALAIPKFVKATDYGNEEDEVATETAANAADTGSTNRPAPTATNSDRMARDGR
jgi:type II secretory pathway pseudopilin PulG